MSNKNNEGDGGFVVHVYSPGNMFANNITFEAPVYIGGSNNLSEQFGYSDEQIAQAIEAICGDGKPLDSKQKWVAVYWYLRWLCNYPVKGSEFCERIAQLPFTRKLSPECDYNNIRRLVTCSLMEQDARKLDSVRPSQADKALYDQCRPVVLALAQEIGKMALPKR